MIGANTTVTIHHRTPDEGAEDELGEPTFTTAVSDPTPANVTKGRGVAMRDGTRVAVEHWVARLPSSAVVATDDLLEDEAGRMFTVRTVVERRDPWGRVWHLTAELDIVDGA